MAENRGQNRERAVLVMRLQSHLNRGAEDGGRRGRRQSKSGVGNATSVASKQGGRKSENRGAEDREAENRERAALVMRLQSHLNR